MSNRLTLADCLTELEFISSIPPNHKPLYGSKRTVHKDAWFTTFKRRWNGEKGEYAVIHVKEVLNSCDQYYRMFLDNVADNILENPSGADLKALSVSLKKTISGFDNLIKTYEDQKDVAKEYEKHKAVTIQLYQDIDTYSGRNSKSISDKSDLSEEESEVALIPLVSQNSNTSFFNTDGIKFMLPNGKKLSK